MFVRIIRRQNAPILVTAGGLIFYCSPDGWFKALDARTGTLLWKHRIENRKHSQPISFLGADGHQYVAVLTASSSVSSGTLYAFSLPH